MAENYTNCCRFCLKYVEYPDRIEISEETKIEFQSAINVYLKVHEFLPGFHCVQCITDLKFCIEIKEKFARNQKILENCFSLSDDEKELNDIKPQILVEVIKTEDLEGLEDENEESLDFDESDYFDESFRTTDGRKKIPCQDCKKLFGTDNLKKHRERMHLKIINFVCEICQKGFYDKMSYESHLKAHEDAKEEECAECNLNFNTKTALSLHMKIKHENRYEQNCPFCNKICSTKSNLDTHIRAKHTGERKYACPMEGCDKTYFSSADLIKHKKNGHITLKACDICSMEVKNLKRHMERHKESPDPNSELVKRRSRVPCTDCGKMFRIDSIKRHRERIHLKIKNWECSQCARSFFSKCQLESHVKVHQAEKTEACTECDLKFYDQSTLFNHIRLVHEKRYAKPCEICGKVYMTKSKLEDHIRSKHTGDRKYACPFEGCDKRFFASSDMIRHRKKYHKAVESCPICHMSVKYLSNHMRNHEEKKLICNHSENGQICNKQYTTKSLLQNHINRAHLGIKKYICSFCETPFCNHQSLYDHIRNVHEQKRIQCELCKTLITRKSYYTKHIMERHRELDDETREALLQKIRVTKDDDLFNYFKTA